MIKMIFNHMKAKIIVCIIHINVVFYFVLSVVCLTLKEEVGFIIEICTVLAFRHYNTT